MRATLWDSLEHLYPDTVVSGSPARSAVVEAARGGTAAVNIFLMDLPRKGGEVRFTVQAGSVPLVEARWLRLIDVPVEANTGSEGFIEKDGQRNAFVTRRAPFRVFDAMEPVQSFIHTRGRSEALRLEIPISPQARPGRREYSIYLTGADSQALRLTVNVHSVRVPPAGKDSLPYTNWFSLPLMAERHGLRPWSEAHWQMIARYAHRMAQARQNTFRVSWDDVFTREAGGLVLDARKLERLVRMFSDAGFHYIEGGHVAARTGGLWNSPTFDMVLGGPRATSVEGNADLATACRQLGAEIDRHGWRGRWVQHVADEPTADSATEYRILAGMVRKHLPGVPLVDATMDTTLAGAVDIWCPQAQEYQNRREWFDSQRKLGDRVWFYTCCSPGGPWLNRLLDMELLRPALLGWAAALFGLDGFLHWGLNQYRPGQDPFERSVVGHGPGQFLPAGDTHVVYPGKDGPWSSVRLEAQREGLEDYQLLKMLKARNGKRAEEILTAVIRGFDNYNKDVRSFRSARKALLEALE